ncbi:MAG: glycine oxidase ThiO [Rhizomicrobium sp.]
MKVIVVGAGAAGLAIGWRLAQAGAQVAVLERGQPGRGATWAAAGMIAAPDDCETELAGRAADLWPGFAAEIEAASGRPVGYRRDGGLFLATTSEENNGFSARAGEFLSAAAAREMEPRLAPDVTGAIWNPNEAKVDNRALGRALAACLVRAGGELAANETVVCFEMRDTRIVGVRTPFAIHQADVYVLAAGAWSARIQGLPADALPPVVPLKGEMLALEAPAGEALPRPAIVRGDIYMVAQRGRLLVGATVERAGFDSALTLAAREWLLAGARMIMPCLGEWQLAEHWAGLRPGSPDDLPILGASVLDNLFVASGQFRSGILYTPAIAEAVCALVLGGNTSFDIAAYDPRRFAGLAADIRS